MTPAIWIKFSASMFSVMDHPHRTRRGIERGPGDFGLFLRSGGKEWKDQDGRANDSRDLFHCVTHGVYLPMAGNLIL